VLYKGAPAAGATVYFHRNGGAGAAGDVIPTGTVEEDGSFSIASGDANGAPAGTYTVLIAWQDRSSSANGMPGVTSPTPAKAKRNPKSARTTPKIRPSPSLPSDRLKGRYADPDHPLLKAEVKPETNSLAPFELTD